MDLYHRFPDYHGNAIFLVILYYFPYELGAISRIFTWICNIRKPYRIIYMSGVYFNKSNEPMGRLFHRLDLIFHLFTNCATKEYILW